VKRIFDMVFSAVVVATILPSLCVVVWLLHRRQSPGPLFFKQERVGKNGVPFQVYKFRTLHVHNDDEAKQVTKDDSRVFKGGQLLRKLSIDEMPQFLNVLLGDMSVVGPRPHMEQHDCEFREIFERYGVRRYVKPGVTGLAQVKGFRGEINRPQDLRHRARLDNFYVTHWCLYMDLKIIAATGWTVIKPPKTAY
jgi:lipopolysaccharide/colanic/teichoic acid biosynthesis glycosyltransferase